MNNLIARLKVTSTKTAPGPKAPIAAIKNGNAPSIPVSRATSVPMPTSIKVAPATVAKPQFIPNTRGREAELIKAATAVKTAEANAMTEKRFNEHLLENLKKEYTEYIKKLMSEMEETGPLYFAVKEEPKTEEPAKTVEPVPVPADNTVPQPLGNLGEIEPAPKKTRKRKSSTQV